VHPDVAALLQVQADDVTIHDLEARMAALAPRLEALAHEHQRARTAWDQAQQAVAAEERRQRDLQHRVSQHRQLLDKNQSQLGSVHTEREATAAMAQLDQAKRMIVEDEREMDSLARRLEELRRAAADREAAAHTVEQQQVEARQSLDADTRMIEAQLAQARADREQKAASVPRALLQRYERIRSKKRVHAVFPLRGNSCSACDTMIPLQRRTMMSAGATEICEGCGVLLYASD
jgi:predicted  nucleic acid-binding Zn-ribbon protein